MQNPATTAAVDDLTVLRTKKERALAEIRDKLDKEKKHLERLASHAEKKRQEAEEAMQKHAVKQHELDALELEVEQARIKAMVPTPVPSPEHVTPVPTPQPSDAGSAVNEEGAIVEKLWKFLCLSGGLA